MINSFFIDKVNSILYKIQSFFFKYTENSLIIKNINNVIFGMICLLIILGSFADTEILGNIAIFIIFLAIFKLIFQKGQKIELAPFDGILVVLLGLMILSTLNSPLQILSLKGLSKYIIYVMFYFSIIPVFKKSPRKILWIILTITAVAALESFYSILQSKSVLAGATWQDTSYLNPEDVINRVYGTLRNPNLLAGYLIVSLPAVIGTIFITLEKRHRKTFLMSLVILLLVIYTIFQTGCRGAYLGLIAILIGFIIVSCYIVFYDFSAFKKIQKWWKKFIITVISLGLVSLVLMPRFLHRLMSIFLLRADSSTSFRLNVYQSSLHMFSDNWLLGVGLGNSTFREIYGYYMKTGFDALGAYSVPLEFAVESGILGLISFLTFIVVIFYTAVKYLMQNQSIRDKIYVSIALFTIIGVMAHGLFDTIFFRPQIQFIFWIIIAILNGVIYTKERNR